MADEELLPVDGEKKERKGGFNIMGLIITVVVGIICGGIGAFVLIQMVGTNTPDQTSQPNAIISPVEIRVRFIVEGTNKTFMLKGAKEIVLISTLSFKVGSNGCRELIAERKDQILSALQDLFISKTKMELGLSAGIALLKKQIQNLVNRETDFNGDRAKFGVTDTYLHITAITSVQ